MRVSPFPSLTTNERNRRAGCDQGQSVASKGASGMVDDEEILEILDNAISY